MGLSDSTTREKLLAVIVIITLAATLLFTTVIDPQLKKYKRLSSQLAQLQLDLTKARGNLLIRDRIEIVYSQIEPLIAVQGSQQQISDFSRLLDQSYSNLNVTIRSVRILPRTDADHYQKLSIRIEMTGAMKDVLKFIESIEQHEEPIRIEQFDLTARESKDMVTISMIISRIVSAGHRSAEHI